MHTLGLLTYLVDPSQTITYRTHGIILKASGGDRRRRAMLSRLFQEVSEVAYKVYEILIAMHLGPFQRIYRIEATTPTIYGLSSVHLNVLDVPDGRPRFILAGIIPGRR